MLREKILSQIIVLEKAQQSTESTGEIRELCRDILNLANRYDECETKDTHSEISVIKDTFVQALEEFRKSTQIED